MALVSINARIEHGWDTLQAQGNAEAARRKADAGPMTPSELARKHYAQRLAFDDQIRNVDPLYASLLIDDVLVAKLRSLVAGTLNNEEAERVLWTTIKRFETLGNIEGPRYSPSWREAVRALADAELNFLERMVERDEGISPSAQKHPAHLAPAVVTIDVPDLLPPVSLRGLLEDHIRHLEISGRGRAARKAWPRVLENLLSFLKQHRALTGHAIRSADDARLLAAEEVIAWRDRALTRLNAKTVRDVWIASIKAVLQHALEDRKILQNPAKDVKVRYSAPARVREKGYTDLEAQSILVASRAYAPPVDAMSNVRESAPVTAAKRWGPLLLAFTGARVTEILQLRKSDVRHRDNIHFIRITPDAGTVKTRTFRDVPLHSQVIEQGFLTFVAGSADGPLFYSPKAGADKLPAQVVAGRLSSWLQESGLVPEGVAPNHGWRHRFKTQKHDLGLDSTVVDAIQGHAGRTASDAYGDVSLLAKKAAIDRLPAYAI